MNRRLQEITFDEMIECVKAKEETYVIDCTKVKPTIKPVGTYNVTHLIANDAKLIYVKIEEGYNE